MPSDGFFVNLHITHLIVCKRDPIFLEYLFGREIWRPFMSLIYSGSDFGGVVRFSRFVDIPKSSF